MSRPGQCPSCGSRDPEYGPGCFDTWHTQDASNDVTIHGYPDVGEGDWDSPSAMAASVEHGGRPAAPGEGAGSSKLEISPSPTTSETGDPWLKRYEKQMEITSSLLETVESLQSRIEELEAWFREAEGQRDYWRNREKKRTAALSARIEELERERDGYRDAVQPLRRLVDTYAASGPMDEEGRALLAETLASLQEARGLLERFAHIADGQEGRTTMTMQMHGFSPVRALQDVIDSSRTFLSSTKETE